MEPDADAAAAAQLGMDLTTFRSRASFRHRVYTMPKNVSGCAIGWAYLGSQRMWIGAGYWNKIATHIHEAGRDRRQHSTAQHSCPGWGWRGKGACRVLRAGHKRRPLMLNWC